MPPRTDKTGPDPADTQAMAEERFAQIQGEMTLPPPPHVRNINLDTHVGFYPQRPYAHLEDHMGSHVRGPGSYEDLAASLPDGPENQIEQDAQGNWVRYVAVPVDQVRDENGVVYTRVEDTPRRVALTQEQARAATAAGVETDWWNGFTWFRRGYKPEKELFNVAPVGRKTRLVRAGAETQALAEREDLRKAANAPLLPRVSAADDGGKEK